MLAAVPLAGQVIPLVRGPKPETTQAFDHYVRITESNLAALPRGCEGFLWAGAADLRRRLQQGTILTQPRYDRGNVPVASGLIHDYVGAIFIPSARVEDVLKVVRDYNDHRNTYLPEVLESRILWEDRDEYKVYLRLMKRSLVTVVMDTEHEIKYEKLGTTCWQSRSRSTSIREVQHPGGGKRERQLPLGEDHGFMWRVNSSWRFHEGNGGTYVECEVVSLSRGVPRALAPFIAQTVRGLPLKSMAETLRATGAAFEKGRPRAKSGK
jgi:hypothetical protein